MVDHFGELGEGYFDGVGRHCGWCRVDWGVIKSEEFSILNVGIDNLVYCDVNLG